MEGQIEEHESVESLRKQFLGKSVIKQSDMSAESQQEIQDIISSSIEQFSAPSFHCEMAAKSIKEQLDKKYGTFWHCVIGEGYAFDVNYQQNSLLFMYYNGNIGVLIFKS